MILEPLRNNATRQRVADVKPTPSPVGGWNARDGWADMKPTDAIRLDNYFPTAEGTKLRGGSARHVKLDGVTTAPETLMVYSSGSTNKMLAVADGNIYDVTNSGTVSSTLATGLLNDRFSYENMGGYIVFVNGEDTPRKYDGSSVTTTSITGVTAANLNYICEFKGRLFFIEKNTLNVWYLAVAAIAGAATKLDFSTYCSLGGKLVAIGRWTRDGGSGADDFIVFLTDKGEAVIYQGTDPASADTWALVGVFRIGAPIGNRPLLSVGADLVVITDDGFIPLSKVLPIDRVGAERVALSDKIRNAVNIAARSYRSIFGWQAIFYAAGNWGLFNIPTVEGSTANQYVINTITGAWCKFSGMDAVCWEVFNNTLYFGAPGGFIVEADTDDYADDTLETVQDFANIQGDIRPAFQYFGRKTTQKRFTMVRPLVRSTASVSLALAMDTDFKELSPETISTPESSGTPWGSLWGSPWEGGETIRSNWVSVSGIGYSGSLHIRTATQGISITLDSIDYAYENGGIL